MADQIYGDNWITDSQAKSILRKSGAVPPGDEQTDQINKLVDALFDNVQRITISDLLAFAYLQWKQNQPE